MTLPAPVSLSGFSLRLTKRTASVVINRKAITSQLLAVSLICALCLQCVLGTASRNSSAITEREDNCRGQTCRGEGSSEQSNKRSNKRSY